MVIKFILGDNSGHAVYCLYSLGQLEHWDQGFEPHPRYDVCPYPV
jgi:hypothetical protein